MHVEGQGGAQFRAIARAPSLAEQVSSQLLETIRSQLRVGDPLPSERELGEQFGVSRTVVREAVRGLAAKGVLDVKGGRGLRVAAVGSAGVSELLRLYLRSRRMGYEAVHEVRLLLEIHIAGLAASRASGLDARRIAEAHERMACAVTDVEASAQADLAFHRRVAWAAGNELYPLLLDSICGCVIDVRVENLGEGYGDRALAEHEAILACIAGGDVEGARTAMSRHLEAVAINLRNTN